MLTRIFALVVFFCLVSQSTLAADDPKLIFSCTTEEIMPGKTATIEVLRTEKETSKYTVVLHDDVYLTGTDGRRVKVGETIFASDKNSRFTEGHYIRAMCTKKVVGNAIQPDLIVFLISCSKSIYYKSFPATPLADGKAEKNSFVLLSSVRQGADKDDIEKEACIAQPAYEPGQPFVIQVIRLHKLSMLVDLYTVVDTDKSVTVRHILTHPLIPTAEK